MTAWPVERAAAPPAAVHALEVPTRATRLVRVWDPTGRALVLGSTQPDRDVDRARADTAGVEVVRRRSGGGAVLVTPGALVWVDVVGPAGDSLWHDDVGRSFHWLGDAWARALATVGVAAHVHRGPLEVGRWGRAVCFAGLGPGELLVDGRKVVGLAQRRWRAGCLFQSAALLAWDPAALVDVLALADDKRSAAVAELAPVAAGLGVAAAALVDAFLGALP